MNVLIIILNYNGIEILKKNLSSVVKNDYPTFDILLVDNNSTDNSIKYVKETYPNVMILKNDANLGFGKANNIAVSKYPNYDAYLFLNNDMYVEKKFLTHLVKVLEKDNEIGAVGPKILYYKKKDDKYIINSAGIKVTKHYMAYDRYEGEIDNDKINVAEEVDALTGGALLVRKEAYNKVNGFNDKMFFYYEDVDLSLRLRDNGYKLYYCGKSVVYHDHMGTAKKMFSSTKRNILSMKNRFITIKERENTFKAIELTSWYLYNWLLWKIFYGKKLTLKDYLSKKDD
ncbi:glycosyltransferase family 2 protein [bacterium]|nr:glycosyltransferase family 2 protein [bacterium]